MNELITDIKSLEIETLKNLKNSKAANTLRAYKSDFKDFSVLYRTNAQSRSLEESLRKLSIPYKIYGGLSFYQRKEIKDILSYFRMSINPKDEEALKRIINYPSRGIGLTTFQKLLITANDNNISIWEVISELEKYNVKLNSGTKKKLSDFAIPVSNIRSRRE